MAGILLWMADVGVLVIGTSDDAVGVMWCKCLVVIFAGSGTVFSTVVAKQMED